MKLSIKSIGNCNDGLLMKNREKYGGSGGKGVFEHVKFNIVNLVTLYIIYMYRLKIHLCMIKE